MFHFLRVVMMGKYSRIHLCQNDCSATWTAFHFCLFTMSRGFSTGHINKFGLAVPDLTWTPQSRWCHHLGGLRVDHLWWIQFQSRWFLVIVFNCFFAIFTIPSMAPLIHGLTGGLKSQLIFQGIYSASILSWSKLFSDLASSLWAPVKLVPLSLKMFFGCPLLEINWRKANIKLLVDRLPTSSIWTARVLKQVKIAPYLLEVPSVERVRLRWEVQNNLFPYLWMGIDW